MAAAIMSYPTPSHNGPVPIAAAGIYTQHMNDVQEVSKPMGSGKSPGTPRGRRERPCDACRKRKSKCVPVENQKNCAACGHHGQECTYVEDPQPRKRRAEGDGKERDNPKRRSATSSTQDGVEGNIFTRQGGSTIKSEYEMQPALRLPQDFDPFQSQHYGTHIGPTTELEPMLFDISSSGGNIASSHSYQKPDGHTAFLVGSSGNDKNHSTESAVLQHIDRLVGPYKPQLIRTYMDTVHNNLPVVSESLLRELEVGGRKGTDTALLSAIYAVTAPWLQNFQAGPTPVDVVQLEDIALRSFGDSLGTPGLSTIQAGLLLMQRPNIDSKALNAQLLGIAYEVGLHLDCSSWRLSSTERGLRKRLAWALYMQDKWCSLIHGRPSAISKDNWAVQELADEDFIALGSLEGLASVEDFERGRALFKHMVGLTEILSNVLDTFYTLQAMHEFTEAGPSGTRLILDKAKPVQITLKDWFAKLPGDLKMDNMMMGKPSSTGYLHLAYFATEITLHRCIIRSLESNNNDPYLSHICRAAAKTRLISAMDFVNRLRSEHLSSFWYFPSRVNFALIGTFGSLLLATAPCQEEADFYRKRLAEYRWTLSVSSRKADFLSFAVDSLDSSSSLLQNLPPKPFSSELVQQGVMPGVSDDVGVGGTSLVGKLSTPEDEMMGDGSSDLHLGHLPLIDLGGPSGTTSGLQSPSTSSSDASGSYEAYAEVGTR